MFPLMIFGAILLIPSLILFLRYDARFQKIKTLTQNGELTTAKIVELQIIDLPSTEGDGLESTEAVLTYTVNHQVYRLKYAIDRNLSTSLANLKVDDTVEILYDAKNPLSSILKVEQNNENLTLVRNIFLGMLIIGILMIFTGLLINFFT